MKILGPPIITVMAFTILVFFLYQYWHILNRQPQRYRVILFTLRTLSILFVIFLLLNPWLNWTSNSLSSQKISVVFDLSESVFAHLDRNKMEYVHKKVF